MRRLGVSRRDLFLELDRPALKELPAEPYQYAEWRVRRVGLDYHVEIDGHYYSVPHRLIREQLDARITERTIELFCKGERVAVHMRGTGRGRHTTVPEHMPSAHRRYAEWTIERIGIDAAAIGPSTANQRPPRRPGRHQSERPADFDRNRRPTSIGMPGRHRRNAHTADDSGVPITGKRNRDALFCVADSARASQF